MQGFDIKMFSITFSIQSQAILGLVTLLFAIYFGSKMLLTNNLVSRPVSAKVGLSSTKAGAARVRIALTLVCRTVTL